MNGFWAFVLTCLLAVSSAEFVDVDSLETLYIPRTYYSVNMTSNKKYFRLECTTCHQLSNSHAFIISLTNLSSNTEDDNLILYLMDEDTVSGFQLYYDSSNMKWNQKNLRAVGMQTWANDNDYKYLKYEAHRQSETSGQIPLSWVLGIANQNYQLSQLDQQFQSVDLSFDLEIAVDSKLCPNDCSKAIYGTIGYCSTQLLRCICLTSYDGDDCRYYMPDLRYEQSVTLTSPETGWTYAKLTFIQSSASNIYFDIQTSEIGLTAYFLEYPQSVTVLWQEIPSYRYYDHKYVLQNGMNSFALPFTQESANVFVGVEGPPNVSVTYSTHYSSSSSNKNLIIILFFVGFAFLALWICLMFIKYSKRRRRRLADAIHDENQQQEAENANRLRYKVDRYYPSITHLEVRAVYVLLRKYRPPPQQCVICLDPFRLEQEVRMMSCLHFFHTKCIDEWFKKNSTCPCCNRDFNRRANLMFNANEFIKIDEYDKRKMEEISPRLNSSFSGWMLRRQRPIFRHSCPALDFGKNPIRAASRVHESAESGEPRTARILSPPTSTMSIHKSELFFKRRQDLDLSIQEFQSPRPKRTHFPLFASQKLKLTKDSRSKKAKANASVQLNQVTEKQGYKTHIGGFLQDTMNESKQRIPLSKHSMYPESMKNIIESMRSSQLVMSIKFGTNPRERQIRSLMNLSGNQYNQSHSGQILNLKQKQVSAHTLAIKFAPIIPNLEKEIKPHGSSKSMKFKNSLHRSKNLEQSKKYEEEEETGQIQTTFENYMNEIEHINNQTSFLGSTPFAQLSGIDKLKSSAGAQREKRFKIAKNSGLLSSLQGSKGLEGTKKTTNVLVLSNAALFESTESQQKSNAGSSYMANYLQTYKKVMSPVRQTSSGSLAHGASLRKSRIFPKQDIAVVRQSQQLISPRRPVYPLSDRSSHDKVGEENVTQSLLSKQEKKPISMLQKKLYDAVNLNQQALGKSTPRVNEAIQSMTPKNRT